jgi:predicted GNAT family acetyltransferase
LPPPDPAVEPLGRDDVDDVSELLGADPDREGFFVPQLLDFGHHHGIRVGGRLVAMTGVHVLSERFGVAAIGNVVTRPDHRRRGYARGLVATQCHGLVRVVPVVGLNVADGNDGARRLYEALGFVPSARYDEAELELLHG